MEMRRPVEFVGGPFDGHVEICPSAADQLPEDLLWPVSDNVFRCLDGRRKASKPPVTSIAVYERRLRGGAWRYVFVGALPPHQVSWGPGGNGP